MFPAKLIKSNLNIYNEPPYCKQLYTRYGINTNSGFQGISYYKISNELQEQLLNIIPGTYRKFFGVLWMEINTPYIPPHTDSDISTVINIYLNTDDAVTTFYYPNVNAQKSRVDNQTNGLILNEHDLVPMTFFKANPLDMWILNVNELHSVKGNGYKTRTAYCLQTKLDYDTVLKIFNH
jgi:hypothetical protein